MRRIPLLFILDGGHDREVGKKAEESTKGKRKGGDPKTTAEKGVSRCDEHNAMNRKNQSFTVCQFRVAKGWPPC